MPGTRIAARVRTKTYQGVGCRINSMNLASGGHASCLDAGTPPA
jgi:hypothetical protein